MITTASDQRRVIRFSFADMWRRLRDRYGVPVITVIAPVIALCVVAVWLGGYAHAVEYVVDSTLSSSIDPNYQTLNDLIAGVVTWNDDDRLTIKNGDNSIGAYSFIDAGAASITITGYGTITPDNPINTFRRFAVIDDGGSLLLLAQDAATLIFDSFKFSNLLPDGELIGAVVNSKGVVTLGTDQSTGTLIFSNNSAKSYGGAIEGGGFGTVNLSGGTNTFTHYCPITTRTTTTG